MINLHALAAAAPLHTVRYLNGKIWIPVKGFESHLDEELALQRCANADAAAVSGKADMEWFHIEPSGASGGSRAAEGFAEAAAQPRGPVYCEAAPSELFWKQLCWERPFAARFESIGAAAELLRSIQRNWAHYPLTCFRRATLIEAKLPYISKKEKTFPYTIPLAGMGVWSLLDEHTLLASAETSSPLPLGVIRFAEDHCNPPSRAYLKLWEALSLADFYRRSAAQAECRTLEPAATDTSAKNNTVRRNTGIAYSEPSDMQHSNGSAAPDTSNTPPDSWALPQPGSRCIDAGACPGGWTWVLRNLGADITAIDRSPLTDALMRDPHVAFLQHDAFTLTPEQLGPQDWVFSDVICYPPRLLEWVERWRASGLCSKFICTIKMQGKPDFDTIRRFAAIPHSKIIHLTANKHELTWLHAPFID